MARPAESRAWFPRILCWVLVACILASTAAAAAAWHRYRLLVALPPERSSSGGDALLKADMWFGNLMGWRKAMIVVSGLLLIAWLDSMRSLADVVWPQGQRRSRAWLIFGWWFPIGNLFVIKMFVNDLWAADQANHRRGHPLLTAWWLVALATFGSSGTRLAGGLRLADVGQASGQMQQVILTDALVVLLAALTMALLSQLSRRLERAAAEITAARSGGSGRQPAVG